MQQFLRVLLILYLYNATLRLTSTSTSISAFFLRSYSPVSYYSTCSSGSSGSSSGSSRSRSNIPFTLIHTKSVVSHSLPKPIHFLCKPRCDAEKQRYRTRCYLTVSSKNSESISGDDDDNDADDAVDTNRKEVAKYEQTSENEATSTDDRDFLVYLAIDSRLSQPLEIKVSEGDNLNKIKERLKIQASPDFDPVPLYRIELFKSIKAEKPLNALETWNPSVSWGTKHQPLIVKTPDIETNSDVATAVTTATTTRISNRLEEAIMSYFGTKSVKGVLKIKAHSYRIDKVFGKPYWTLSDRFIVSSKEGILYRPEIANEIYAAIEKLLQHPYVASGLMIKGPQGIGKSHSIVNVVRKLQSTGKYLVTVILDCEYWTSSFDLVNAICLSIGTTAVTLGIQKFDETPSTLRSLIDDIAEVLEAQGKQWVFVFDQINRLFARFPDRKDVGSLPFPFNLIKTVMAVGRITTIISASANNEISYKESHPGFLEYIHRTDMTNSEIQIIYPTIINNGNDDEKILRFTGKVPIYLRIFCSPEFVSDLYQTVNYFLIKLKNEQRSDWRAYTRNMSMILLKIECSTRLLQRDKKFFFEEYDTGRNFYSYKPLSPIIEDAVCEFFRDDLMKYVGENESALQMVFNMPTTTGDTRGRIFEGLVIRRCMTRGVEIATAGILGEMSFVVPSKCDYFQGNSLPSPYGAEGVYVPSNPNFPAIDMVWISHDRLIGVQIHTNKSHGDVFDKFLELCRAARWINENQKVCLLYLCPYKECTVSFAPRDSSVQIRENVTIGYITSTSLSCLENLGLENHWLDVRLE